MRGTTLKKKLKTKLAQFYTGLMVNKGLSITVKVALYLERDLRFAGVRMGRGGPQPVSHREVQGEGPQNGGQVAPQTRRCGSGRTQGRGVAGRCLHCTPKFCAFYEHIEMCFLISLPNHENLHTVYLFMYCMYICTLYIKRIVFSPPPGRIFAPLAILPH